MELSRMNDERPVGRSGASLDWGRAGPGSGLIEWQVCGAPAVGRAQVGSQPAVHVGNVGRSGDRARTAVQSDLCLEPEGTAAAPPASRSLPCSQVVRDEESVENVSVRQGVEKAIFLGPYPFLRVGYPVDARIEPSGLWTTLARERKRSSRDRAQHRNQRTVESTIAMSFK
jgi:hypothetical protein